MSFADDKTAGCRLSVRGSEVAGHDVCRGFRAICPTFDKSDKTDLMSLTMNLDGCQDALDAYIVSNTAMPLSACDILHSDLR
jgi:hypothetical protein